MEAYQPAYALQDLGKIGVIDVKASGTANVCGKHYDVKATKVEGELNVCDKKIAKLINLNDINNENQEDEVYFLI